MPVKLQYRNTQIIVYCDAQNALYRRTLLDSRLCLIKVFLLAHGFVDGIHVYNDYVHSVRCDMFTVQWSTHLLTGMTLLLWRLLTSERMRQVCKV